MTIWYNSQSGWLSAMTENSADVSINTIIYVLHSVRQEEESVARLMFSL